MKTKTTLLALALLVAGAAATAAFPAASAHYCKSTNHESCSPNAHSCPNERESHHHIHDVKWKPDHYCKSYRMTTGAAAIDGEAGVPVVEYGYTLDEIPCTGVPLPAPVDVTAVFAPPAGSPLTRSMGPVGIGGPVFEGCLDDVTVYVAHATLA